MRANPREKAAVISFKADTASDCDPEPAQQPVARTRKPSSLRGKIAGFLACLLIGAQLAAAAHTHRHTECENEADLSRETPCMLCVVAGTLMLAADGVPAPIALAPGLPGPNTLDPAVCHGISIAQRARAPPFAV